jgi:predicted transcriptional regulator
LDFLAGQAQAESLQPGDVTIGRLAERIGRSEATAKRILAREMRAGHIVRVRCVNEMGRMEYAYRPAKGGGGA